MYSPVLCEREQSGSAGGDRRASGYGDRTICVCSRYGKRAKNPGELPCICGELLEELVLPGTVERIGRYVFYNCRYFREFTFGANIRYMGAGAFTGCKRLSKLHVRDMGQENPV